MTNKMPGHDVLFLASALACCACGGSARVNATSSSASAASLSPAQTAIAAPVTRVEDLLPEPKRAKTTLRFSGARVVLQKTLLGRESPPPVLSPDGSVALFEEYRSRPGTRLMAAGRSEPLGKMRINRITFADDSSSVALPRMADSMEEPFGFLVLKLPSFERVFDSKDGSDPVYADARTIVFRRDRSLARLEVSTGVVRPIGGEQTSFGCGNTDALAQGVRGARTCTEERWTQLLWVDPKVERGVVVDFKRGADGVGEAVHLRAVMLASGESSTLYDARSDPTQTISSIVLSGDRRHLCFELTGLTDVRWHKLVCGAPTGPFRVALARPFNKAFQYRFWDGAKLVVDGFEYDAISSKGPPSTSARGRVLDLDANEEVELDFWPSERASLTPLPGNRFIQTSAGGLLDFVTHYNLMEASEYGGNPGPAPQRAIDEAPRIYVLGGSDLYEARIVAP